MREGETTIVTSNVQRGQGSVRGGTSFLGFRRISRRRGHGTSSYSAWGIYGRRERKDGEEKEGKR